MTELIHHSTILPAYSVDSTYMGVRKKNNQIEKQRREKAPKKRNEKKLKRAAKEKTAGQKLHDKMHGRSA